MRTALQHAWATMNHDTGYKTGVEVPVEYLRNMNRLAGMLELADDEFSRIRCDVTDYRRRVEGLVRDGKFDEVPLNVDTFRRYLSLNPFDKLNKRIAAINQAEIHETTAIPYLTILRDAGCNTLGDLEKLIQKYSEPAYQLALSQIGGTDLDIISSTVAIQDLILTYILIHGGGQDELEDFFNQLNGASSYNKTRAARIIEQANHLEFMNRK